MVGIALLFRLGRKISSYLEWDMKLWWPQCEAMVTFAMLYEDTKRLSI